MAGGVWCTSWPRAAGVYCHARLALLSSPSSQKAARLRGASRGAAAMPLPPPPRRAQCRTACVGRPARRCTCRIATGARERLTSGLLLVRHHDGCGAPTATSAGRRGWMQERVGWCYGTERPKTRRQLAHSQARQKKRCASAIRLLSLYQCIAAGRSQQRAAHSTHWEWRSSTPVRAWGVPGSGSAISSMALGHAHRC